MREVVFGSMDKLEIKGANVSSFLIQAKVSHGTDNIPFSANPIDWSQVNVKANLRRGGRNYTVFADVVFPLAADSAFYAGNWDQLFNIGTVGYQRVTVAAAATKEVLLMTAEIKLHEVINLTGDDVLMFEIQPLAAALDANSSVSLSRCFFDYKESIGNGLSIPIIRAQSIRASISSDKFSLGSNLISAKLINMDKAGITYANQVITAAYLNSDKFVTSDTFEELLSKRANSFQSNADHALRNQSFEIFSVVKENYGGQDVRANNVDLQLTFTSGNVNASKNWIVTRGYEVDNVTAQRAIDRANRHRAENSQQYAQ